MDPVARFQTRFREFLRVADEEAGARDGECPPGADVGYAAGDVRGDYEIARRVRTTPDAVHYEAFAAPTGRRVLLIVSRDRIAPDMAARAAVDAATINGLAGRHVPHVAGAESFDERLFLALECSAGPTWSERLSARRPPYCGGAHAAAARDLAGIAAATAALRAAGLNPPAPSGDGLVFDDEGAPVLIRFGLLCAPLRSGVADALDVRALQSLFYEALAGRRRPLAASGETRWQRLARSLGFRRALEDPRQVRKGIPRVLARLCLDAHAPENAAAFARTLR